MSAISLYISMSPLRVSRGRLCGWWVRRDRRRGDFYSHSIVPGGLCVTTAKSHIRQQRPDAIALSLPVEVSYTHQMHKTYASTLLLNNDVLLHRLQRPPLPCLAIVDIGEFYKLNH